MPFDSTGIIVIAKAPISDAKEAALKHIKALERLLELSKLATDYEQDSFSSCLWYRARWDKELNDLGLINAPYLSTIMAPVFSNPMEIFGQDVGPFSDLWSDESLHYKRRIIRRLLKNERAAMAAID